MAVDKWSIDLFFEFLRNWMLLVLAMIFPRQKDSPEQPRLLRTERRLAMAIGLQEAIVLTRLLEWQRYNAAMHKHQTHYIDEKWFTYNSIDEWVTDFGCIKKTTMGRCLRKLEKMKLVETGRYSSRASDVRKWYHVNEDAVFNLVNHDSTLANPSCQNDTMVVSKRRDDSSRTLTTDSSQRKKASKQHHQKPARDVDGDDFTADSGEETLTTERTAAPRFEEKGHEASAPMNPLPVSQGFPLPYEAQALYDRGLPLEVWADYVAKYGEVACLKAADNALRRGANPPGLFRDTLDKGQYQLQPATAEASGKADENYDKSDDGVEEFETDVDSLPYIDPERVKQWRSAFMQLEIQLDKPNFDTWLRDAHLVGFEDETFVIGVRNNYARDMLTHRLNGLVMRIVEDVVGAPVQMRFEVCKPRQRHEDKEMPLYQLVRD